MKNISLISCAMLTIIVCRIESFSQNVGIGTTTPTAKLQLNHRSSVPVPGLLMMDSTAQRSGQIRFRNMNSAKYIELWGFSGNNLLSAEQYLDVESDSTIIATFRGNGRVGINNIAPAERLDVNGNINLTGVLKVNGNAGLAGQVLTSNGMADPQWKNSAFSDPIRFYVNATEGADMDAHLQLVTRYNTSPAEITIGTNSITVNKTGLYYLEGFLTANITYVTTPSHQPRLDFGILTTYYNYLLSSPMFDRRGSTLYVYETSDAFSMQIYLTAGSILRLDPQFIGPPGYSFPNINCNFRGHFISE